MKAVFRSIWSGTKAAVRHSATLPVLTVLSGLAGAILTVNGIAKPPEAVKWLVSDIWMSWAVVVFYLAAIGLVFVALAQAMFRDRVILETKSEMSTLLRPVVNGAHSVATSVAETAATKMKERSLVALRNILDLKGARFCLYLLESTEKDKPKIKDQEKQAVDSLEWDDDPPAGSTKPPRKQTFERGENPVSDANFVVVDSLRSRLISDWRKKAKNGLAHELDCEGASYGGFLVVPIVAGKEAKGILTVDVPERGLLTNHHLAIAELAGRLLGVALHRLKSKSASTSPKNPFKGEQ